MSELIQATRRQIRFYACGGTGVDILRQHRSSANLDRGDITAEELDSYIDTSTSNLKGVKAESVYRLPDIEGGGKDRSKVYKACVPVLPDILLNHKPADFNVVIFSASGGSGSILGPMIIDELLKKNVGPVVAIVSIDYSSFRSADNAINTLEGLQKLSQSHGKAVVVHVTENSADKNLHDNDLVARYALGSLSILASGLNNRLDASDVNHFINYPTVTHHQPGLARLHVTSDLGDLTELKHIASFAAVLRDEESPRPQIRTATDSIGWLPEGTSGYDRDFFFAVTPGLGDLVARLNKLALELKDEQAVQVQTGTITGSGQQVGGSNIVL